MKDYMYRDVQQTEVSKQHGSKKPDLDGKYPDIIGETKLPNGAILPTGFGIWECKKFMYLGKLVDGEWLRYGNQGWRWWCKPGEWNAMQKWIEQVNSIKFIEQYGSNNPPLEKNRVYEPKPMKKKTR